MYVFSFGGVLPPITGRRHLVCLIRKIGAVKPLLFAHTLMFWLSFEGCDLVGMIFFWWWPIHQIFDVCFVAFLISGLMRDTNFRLTSMDFFRCVPGATRVLGWLVGWLESPHPASTAEDLYTGDAALKTYKSPWKVLEDDPFLLKWSVFQEFHQLAAKHMPLRNPHTHK